MRQGIIFATLSLLIAATGAPVASAHWDWTDAPHEHEVYVGNGLGILYGGQRLCVSPSLGVSVSDAQGNCPSGHTPVPPFRGFTTSFGTCRDADGSTVLSTNLKLASPQVTTIDYGAPPATPFAEHFRHGAIGSPGLAPNPTGATPAGYPVSVTSFGSGPQLAIDKMGLGASGTGTSQLLFPGLDIGNNDFELGQGIACQTYAIDSGIDIAGGPPGNGGGAAFNDPLRVGGDGVFDDVPASSLANLAGSPRFPETGAGFLVSPAIDSTIPDQLMDPLPYSVCHALAGSGCTNIPDSVTGGVYASLQDCVWTASGPGPSRVHVTSEYVYRGTQANWGTSAPSGDTNGGTYRSCWPERLAWSPTIGVYMPESLVKDQGDPNAAWNPDHLPATYDSIESITVFFGGAGTVFPPSTIGVGGVLAGFWDWLQGVFGGGGGTADLEVKVGQSVRFSTGHGTIVDEGPTVADPSKATISPDNRGAGGGFVVTGKAVGTTSVSVKILHADGTTKTRTYTLEVK